MEGFDAITGGKDQFERLPEIHLTQAANEKISTAIRRIVWDDLNHPITRTTTLDGRNVIVVKGLKLHHGASPVKGVLAFVEKIDPQDVPRAISNLPELAHAIFAPH